MTLDEDPFSSFVDLEPSEQAGVICSLFEDSLEKENLFRELSEFMPLDDRRGLIRYLSMSRVHANGQRSKTVDANGVSVNPRQLTGTDRKSILYLSHFAHPRPSRDEIAAIFGVSRQRVSQVLGARGHSQTDQQLVDLFNRTKPAELRDHWRVEAHVEQLNDFREGRIAASPVTPRHMTPPPVGRWKAYGRSFEVCERDRLFYFRIDASDEEESNPRASAQEALDDCFAACREEAWADSSGDPNEWFAAFKEDPFGPAHKSNLIRVA
jgi:hypothetical protein